VLTAVRNVKSHSSPRKEDLCTVENAIRNTEDIEIQSLLVIVINWLKDSFLNEKELFLSLVFL